MSEPNAIHIRRTYEPLKFLGRLFWVPLQTLPNTPKISFAPTWEANGERWAPTLVFRAPFTAFAIGVGVWLDVKPGSVVEVHEDDAEYDRYVAVNGEVPRELWEKARKEVGRMGLDPDDEMEYMQAMGVFL